MNVHLYKTGITPTSFYKNGKAVSSWPPQIGRILMKDFNRPRVPSSMIVQALNSQTKGGYSLALLYLLQIRINTLTNPRQRGRMRGQQSSKISSRQDGSKTITGTKGRTCQIYGARIIFRTAIRLCLSVPAHTVQ
jgi:hypothetical protein